MEDEMAYTDADLKNKVFEMYPEIKKHGLSLGLAFSNEENAYILRLAKGSHELTTHLKKIDADECMDNIKCVYLGIQIGEFLKNFEVAE
jgi:hypothetical protein